jgi:hypothetical protein
MVFCLPLVLVWWNLVPELTVVILPALDIRGITLCINTGSRSLPFGHGAGSDARPIALTFLQSTMRTNYILIDFESIQPSSIELVQPEQFRVMVFVGASQNKVSLELAASIQKLGTRAEYIKISGNGPNALDFHIAYYIGQLAERDTSAHFWIVSKDSGFDPLIAHLTANKVSATRIKDISDLQGQKSGKPPLLGDRIEIVLANLRQRKAAKPRTVKTLCSTIASLFQKQLSEEEVMGLLKKLESSGYLSVNGTKIEYVVSNELWAQ